jgi:nucleotide-binding universal stress UspA family protein
MKRILVATDGSNSSTEAVRFGVELAAENEAELIVVHVVPVLDVVPSTGFALCGAFPHEPTQTDRACLDDAAALALEHGVLSTTALLRGDTVDEIVAYAEGHDVDVIVMGSRGRSPVAATLLGSVSAGVLREARRPVVVVRAGSHVAPAESAGAAGATR